MLAGVINSSVATLLAARSSQGAGSVGGATAVARVRPVPLTPPVDRISLSGGAAALKDVAGTVDQLARASNSLAVASATLAKIDGLLDQVHAALADDRSADAARQSAVDAALLRLDQTAAAARFGGRSLFDGTYSVRVTGAAITLPSVSSGTLGADSIGTNNLSSATSSGTNAISSNGISPAVEIVDRASAQIAVTRAEIGHFQEEGIAPALSGIQSTLQDAAPNSTGVSSQNNARTVGLLGRAQAVLRPEQLAAAAGAPAAQHVFSLVA